MQFMIAASTDVGIVKKTNQDSYLVKRLNTPIGEVVFAVLCDGMGGLQKGEVASATIVKAFEHWAVERLPKCAQTAIQDSDIRRDWLDLVNTYNEKIKLYGQQLGVSLGTTVTAILLTPNRYFILNVGDTRAYEISDSVRLLTKDQTVVAREVEQGLLTEAEARRDKRRSVLLQCIGASKVVYPDLFFGETKLNAVYLLCSDGFRHEITVEELSAYLTPDMMTDSLVLKRQIDSLIELNKQRMERDNLTALTVRTYSL